MTYRIGVDIGGTFVDFCVFDEESGKLTTFKLLATPGSPGQDVAGGLRALAGQGALDPARVVHFAHGTTVGVNTLIQRRGARLALLCTEGFRDVLELGRLDLPDIFNLFSERPPSLVPRERVVPVRERIRADGTVSVPLEPGALRAALDRVRSVGAEGVVISFINAYKNPAHEQAARAFIGAEAPELFAVCSTDVWPVIREYERTVTAVIHAYVYPAMRRYFDGLEGALRSAGIGEGASVVITKVNGGVMGVRRAADHCVWTLTSGPASGVIGAAYVAGLAGARNVLTLDVGGTSADIAVITDGEPMLGMGHHVGGYPIYVPAIIVSSIGCGGGSIAWVDELGVLRVGPESAGAEPGPACYGRGGWRPTLTDAFAVCGFLAGGSLAYGALAPRTDLAAAAVKTIADPMDLDVYRAAEAVINLAVSGMYLESSKLLARWGIDPRELSLLAFGGAGPMVGCFLARELGIRRVIIPPFPGVLSAAGAMLADLKSDFIRTVLLDLDGRVAESLRAGFAGLKAAALGWLRQEAGVGDVRAAQVRLSADMRYTDQAYEIEVPIEESWVEAGDIEAVRAAFHAQHEQVYGHSDPAAPVQAVNLRLVVVVPTPKPALAEVEPAASAGPEPFRVGKVFYASAEQTMPFFKRQDLKAGHRLRGPAVVVEDDCTVCIPAGFEGTVDRWGNILLEDGLNG
jgi:N-methylhydantoinase A